MSRGRSVDRRLLVLVGALALGASSCSAVAGGERVPDEGAPRATAAVQQAGGDAAGAGAAQWWTPPAGVAWQWQLSGELDLSVDVPVYDVDWQVAPSVVEELHGRGRRAVCYVSVGSWEAHRSDAAAFPEEVLGEPLEGWPDERWLDVRRLDLLEGPLGHRLDVCRDTGFDAVEPDNVDGYVNRTGFPLTADDQLVFNRWVADQAHRRGMAVGLKNDLDQVAEFVDDVDFAVDEECLQHDECALLEPFVEAGKPVLHVEYALSEEEFCRREAGLQGFSSMLKDLELSAYRHTCPREG
ncbi:endo alpha-1,4 polygalactosaminidase [uncultured Pseudokineococcus sp.]|uniref:endo alpha-1,4 polygalactosaminidase n=1 Tax=uncultured Pseudokineococcus sp. TaxID=1642928 RepID=UPI00262C4924|nr:endo alpha-1,4 polygalactosaminidase [uncultured Pseudokineococcus sp.]